MLADESILQRKAYTRVHLRVIQEFTECRAVGVCAHALFDDRFGKERGDAPYRRTILIQDIPLHLAAYERLQGVLEIILVLAMEFENPHEVMDADMVPFLGGQFIIGVRKQDVPSTPLQQGHIVLYL